MAARSRAFICSSIICNIRVKVPITFPSHVIRKYHLKQRLQIECISLLRLIVQMSESLVSEAIPAISEGGSDGLRPADSCQVGMMVQQCLSRSWKSRLYVKFMNFKILTSYSNSFINTIWAKPNLFTVLCGRDHPRHKNFSQKPFFRIGSQV